MPAPDTPAPPRLLVFDLDGTLIDSSRDLCNSINATLAHFDRPELPDPVIASYIGDGASMLVRRAFGDPEGDVHDEHFVSEALHFFLGYYRVHKLDFTLPYPGVLQSLTDLRNHEPRLAVACLTNKPVRPAEEICNALGLGPSFFRIYGGDSFHTKKPDPHGLCQLIQEAAALDPSLGAITAAETVMIGDSAVDILTARNCGAQSIGCTFGLAPHSLEIVPPDHLAHSPGDWPALVGSLAAASRR